ncbi:MAG TPA: outer membrane beta-barrel protein [Gemmatimonadales bacterium]|nr:outer membrane beta-barrel protein [Gemmatimonadales bacterium]
MRTIRRGMAAAAAILLLGGAAAAQTAPRGLVEVSDESGRRGFWAGFGLGAGGEAFDLRDGAGYSGELYRPTVSLRLGGTPNRYLRLGGEVLAWIDDQGRQTESITSLLFVTQLYPAPQTGLYLKGGLGLGRSEVDFDDGFGVGDTGFAGLLGAGWEVRVGRRLYLNPAVDLVQHRYTGRGGERYRERIVNFGLGVLFQSGR